MSQYFQRLMQRTGLESKKQSVSMRHVFRPVLGRSALSSVTNVPGVVVPAVFQQPSGTFRTTPDFPAEPFPEAQTGEEAPIVHESFPAPAESIADETPEPADEDAPSGLARDNAFPEQPATAASDASQEPGATYEENHDAGERMNAGVAANDMSDTHAADTRAGSILPFSDAAQALVSGNSVQNSPTPASAIGSHIAGNEESGAEQATALVSHSPVSTGIDAVTDPSEPAEAPGMPPASHADTATNTDPVAELNPTDQDQQSSSLADVLVCDPTTASPAEHLAQVETPVASGPAIPAAEDASVFTAASATSTDEVNPQNPEDVMHIDMDALAHAPGVSRFALHTRVVPPKKPVTDSQQTPAPEAVSAPGSETTMEQAEDNAASRAAFGGGSRKGARWGEGQGRHAFGKRPASRQSWFKS